MVPAREHTARSAPLGLAQDRAGTELLSCYNAEMNDLIRAFRDWHGKPNRKSAYLFLVPPHRGRPAGLHALQPPVRLRGGAPFGRLCRCIGCSISTRLKGILSGHSPTPHPRTSKEGTPSLLTTINSKLATEP